MKFYDKLILLMNEKNISRNYLAQQVGITPGAFTNWIRRGSTPKRETFLKIARYFGVTVESLIDDSRDIKYVTDQQPEECGTSPQPLIMEYINYRNECKEKNKPYPLITDLIEQRYSYERDIYDEIKRLSDCVECKICPAANGSEEYRIYFPFSLKDSDYLDEISRLYDLIIKAYITIEVIKGDRIELVKEVMLGDKLIGEYTGEHKSLRELLNENGLFEE